MRMLVFSVLLKRKISWATSAVWNLRSSIRYPDVVADERDAPLVTVLGLHQQVCGSAATAVRFIKRVRMDQSCSQVSTYTRSKSSFRQPLACRQLHCHRNFGLKTPPRRLNLEFATSEHTTLDSKPTRAHIALHVRNGQSPHTQLWQSQRVEASCLCRFARARPGDPVGGVEGRRGRSRPDSEDRYRVQEIGRSCRYPFSVGRGPLSNVIHSGWRVGPTERRRSSWPFFTV